MQGWVVFCEIKIIHDTHLKNPRSTADLFMMTESSWLYPVYEAIATIELIPAEVIEVKQRSCRGHTSQPAAGRSPTAS